MKVWLPAIRADSGTDVFTERLATALRRSVEVEVTWFPHRNEVFWRALASCRPPPGASVIHANSWSAFAFLRHGLPVVATVHHLVHDPAYAPHRSVAQAAYHRLLVRPRERRGVLGCSAVTAVSRYVAGTVSAAFGRHDVRVVPNWVDPGTFSPGAERQRDAGDPVSVLFLGNATRRKGADLLPALARRLGPRFRIGCTGGLRGAPWRDVPGTTALGRLSEPELVQAYRDSDIVLSLSRYEGFGYTALEAMACGRPVVGFATSGLVEVVDSGATGFLERIDDVDAVAARCEQIAADPTLAARLGRAGRERAISRFSPAEVRGYLEIYDAVTSP